ncbi:MAG: dGTP triphosphohydrolase [Pseudomonadota bacterium]
MPDFRSNLAVFHEASKGRLHSESVSYSPLARSQFQHDRDRILHSRAFRRLREKTQVLTHSSGDHHRMRLVHSLEVAQIARSLARGFALDEDLCEAIALAHDLGHPPFGHAGEAVLRTVMVDYGGFDHNVQALRLVTRLEHPYPDFDGLNLTIETLEGMIKHNGPIATDPVAKDHAHPFLLDLMHECAIIPEQQASLEAQIAAISDDIAYTHHDLDDGLRFGFFTLDDLVRHVPAIAPYLQVIDRTWPDLEAERRAAELIRRMVSDAVCDVYATIQARIKQAGICDLDDIRRAASPLASFSSSFEVRIKALRRFLFRFMYEAANVLAGREESCQQLNALFHSFMNAPETLPPSWYQAWKRAAGQACQARVICDYLAGMSDSFALACYKDRLARRLARRLV